MSPSNQVLMAPLNPQATLGPLLLLRGLVSPSEESRSTSLVFQARQAGRWDNISFRGGPLNFIIYLSVLACLGIQILKTCRRGLFLVPWILVFLSWAVLLVLALADVIVILVFGLSARGDIRVCVYGLSGCWWTVVAIDFPTLLYWPRANDRHFSHLLAGYSTPFTTFPMAGRKVLVSPPVFH